MKRSTTRLVSSFAFVLSVSFLTLNFPTSSSPAATYYHKYKGGVIVYTNIPPIEKGYKRVIIRHEDYNLKSKNPFGSFKYSKEYDDHINKTANWHGIDPYLVKAIIKVESNFNAKAVSPKGAMGVMQLMPETARNQGVTNPFDPSENIMGGVRYLKKLIDMFNGNISLALAGYNAGENAVVKYGYAIPPYNETMDYVDKVLVHYNNLKNSLIGQTDNKDEKVDQKYTVNNIGSGIKKNSEPTKEDRVSADPAKKEDKKPSTVHNNLVAEAAVKTAPSVVLADSATGSFTVQIASFPQLEDAQRMEQSLKAKSLPAYIQKTDLPGKGTWYRVRVGTFATLEQAKLYGESLKSGELGIKEVLVTSNR
jgi:cell division septation protein DedD